MLIELIGGPHDGELLARSRRPPAFLWVDDRLHVHCEPAPGRAPYRLTSSRPAVAGGVVLTFMLTLDRVRCEECGWFSPRGRDCSLCGNRLPSRV